MSCDVNALLRQAADFQGMSEREQMAAIAQLLCDISQTGPAWAVVFPNGTAAGPSGVIDTTGTTTSGIQEAINSLPEQTSYAGPQSGGGTLVLAAGQFDCTTQIIIPNNFPYDLTLRGSGKMLTLVNYSAATVQDFIVTQRTASAPGDSAGFPSLNLRISDCAFTYAHTANKAAIFSLTWVNEALVTNCAFATLESFEVPGFGASLVYIDGTPITKPGVVGFALDSVAPGNIVEFRNCAFYGLACGLDISTDHARVENTIFANIGVYFPAGRGDVPHWGTQWTTVTGVSSLAIRRQNCYANGMALVRNGGVWDMNVHYCQWFYCNIAAAAYQSGFGSFFILNPAIESTNLGIVSIGDNASQAIGDDTGPGFTAITQLQALIAGRYMNGLTGILSGTNPRVLTELYLPPTPPDADGAVQSMTVKTSDGTIFALSNNGLTLRQMTKAERDALTPSQTQTIFQTDLANKGIRIWDGSNWVTALGVADP
jgi:hypothetical protein